MTDRDSLLAAILDNPADDTTRLVLADLLRESEIPEQQALGRFLWAGMTAATFRDDDLIEDQLYYTAQAELVAVTVASHPAQWLTAIGVGPATLTKRDWFWDCKHDRVTVRIGDVIGNFARGMLSELAITLAEWYTVAEKVVAAWPIERVTTTDVPGLLFSIANKPEGWCLTARLRLPWRRVPLSGSVIPSAVSSVPFLIDGPADWYFEHLFADRAALVAGIASASQVLVLELLEVAGDRWPTPPRRRR